jgi:lipopolysaccharide transport system ATP-binding protein
MDKKVILKIENVSKQYRLGTIGTGTLSHDLNRFWHKIIGKEDPYLKIGETNDRTTKGKSDYVWAIKNINLDVYSGEVLGIIGKNGAGKSTLLKILSKVTAPTTGVIKSNGRIASLLEVGTGFNPELTGRENIYLNGAILGMTKKEITSKLDEIIAFSGCERYIDTPTKRYSSGMTVRLAFAVAAFLEPEILVVDEVLAVGDAEFQKKAIGKMQDISKTEGRTVLFVSHNMAAIQSLCTRCVIMQNGEVDSVLEVAPAIERYLSLNNEDVKIDNTKYDNFEFINFKLLVDEKESNIIPVFKEFKIKLTFKYLKIIPVQTHIEIFIKDEYGVVVTAVSTWLNSENIVAREGENTIVCFLKNGLSLVQGNYSIDVNFADSIPQNFQNILNFEIINTPYTGYIKHLTRERFGIVYTPNSWE